MINLKDKEDNNMYKCNDDYENIKRKIEEERKNTNFVMLKVRQGQKGIRVILDLKEKGVFQVLLVLMLE